MSDLAARAAALVTLHTGRPCEFPVADFRRCGSVWWLYLYDGHDLTIMAGPKAAERGTRFAVVDLDLQGCRSLGEALAALENVMAPVALFGEPA